MKRQDVLFRNINYQGPFGNTLLHSAVVSGNIGEVERLLSAGADPTIANREGRTAVDIAVVLGHGTISDLLVTRAAQPAVENDASKESSINPRS